MPGAACGDRGWRSSGGFERTGGWFGQTRWPKVLDLGLGSGGDWVFKCLGFGLFGEIGLADRLGRSWTESLIKNKRIKENWIMK